MVGGGGGGKASNGADELGDVCVGGRSVGSGTYSTTLAGVFFVWALAKRNIGGPIECWGHWLVVGTCRQEWSNKES